MKNTLDTLIAKRDALNAKIAALKAAKTLRNIEVGCKVTLKKIPHTITQYEGGGDIPFVVTKVAGKITVRDNCYKTTVTITPDRIKAVK